ncbi:hypothetical protein [Actomonas aquatica]|uniref:Tetratricopeptide repeat-like domain-containing protein n=1 Tax=Actomonas aquatica TaxID=2866162 RepID=A0ABZ1C9G3_9BACT|nr:hypothetical protein [Opitutus sp. WL0086]WRQ87937.1 hypothetical protein K1X11_000855 [Opitutus sp. WL0086]
MTNEVSITALPPRLQELAHKARRALTQGDAAYASEMLSAILAEQPACADLRRPWWEALKQTKPQGALGWLKKLTRGGASKSSAGADPLGQLGAAAKALEADPQSVGALQTMADAAGSMGWTGTQLFALGAVWELAARDKAAGLAMLAAQQSAGRFAEAEQSLARLVQAYPNDGDVVAACQALGVARTMREGRWGGDTPAS